MNRTIYTILSFLLAILFVSCVEKEDTLHVLILSGSNNHSWKKTTPFLTNMYVESGLFSVEITEHPDTLKAQDLADFDVIVSNWNSWPKNDLRWAEETEKAFLGFVEKGGGLVTFHASSSAFYQWPEFKNISTAAWIDSTWHGQISSNQVIVQNNEHTVTKGMLGFAIFDELWVNAEKNEKFEVLGFARNKDISEKGIEAQPVIMVSEYGKGKIFHTTLGHDVRTMRNTGFQTLMLRGTEWAARGKVTQSVPQELRSDNQTRKELNWAKTDSSFALQQGTDLIWQFNFNEKHGKPFFHPIYVGRNNLTCVSPDDHLWHVGQWFSWKYINGVNYWEYQNRTYKSEGVTEIQNINIIPDSDFSAQIELAIIYHPVDGDNVLAERRTINISKPRKDGNVYMDYQFEFTALADSVDINRTPLLGEPDGKSWGGYAGLSIRFNQDFMNSHFISSSGYKYSINGKTYDWLYMGFTGLDGGLIGSQICIAPNSQREGAAWYSVNTNDLPFYYFSPAYLYKKSLLLLKGEKFSLNYRVNHLSGEVKQSELEKAFKDYEQELNQ